MFMSVLTVTSCGFIWPTSSTPAMSMFPLGISTLRAAYLNIRDLLGYDRVLMPMGTVDALGTALAA